MHWTVGDGCWKDGFWFVLRVGIPVVFSLGARAAKFGPRGWRTLETDDSYRFLVALLAYNDRGVAGLMRCIPWLVGSLDVYILNDADVGRVWLFNWSAALRTARVACWFETLRALEAERVPA